MNRIIAHVLSLPHNRLYPHCSCGTYEDYILNSKSACIEYCNKCHANPAPLNITLTTPEICSLRPRQRGTYCIVCRRYIHFARIVAFINICSSCHQEVNTVTRQTFPIKILLARSLPLLPEITAIIIGLM